MRTITLIFLTALVALAGCDNPPDKATIKVKQETRKQRAEAKLDKPPPVRTYNLTDGQLLVMEVPVMETPGFLDNQRCFVWRDAEFKQATLSCPQPPVVDLTGN